jgi:hypothetical protein
MFVVPLDVTAAVTEAAVTAWLRGNVRRERLCTGLLFHAAMVGSFRLIDRPMSRGFHDAGSGFRHLSLGFYHEGPGSSSAGRGLT